MIIDANPAYLKTVSKQELLAVLQQLFNMLAERGMNPSNIQLHAHRTMEHALTAMFGPAIVFGCYHVPIIVNDAITITSDIWMLDKDRL